MKYIVIYYSKTTVMIPSFRSMNPDGENSRESSLSVLRFEQFEDLEEASTFAIAKEGVVLKNVEYEIKEKK